MRKIKFRAWCKVDKTMYTDAINNCKDSFEMILKHPQVYEVMQYTGLKDKNGQEIYEGDIVKINNKYSVVRDMAMFEIFNNMLGRFNKIEIVGNIYENPELLGKLNNA